MEMMSLVSITERKGNAYLPPKSLPKRGDYLHELKRLEKAAGYQDIYL
jgi:hypothetical protein